jgi:hypothetical protein
LGITPFSTRVKQLDLHLRLTLSTPALVLDHLQPANPAEEALERPGRRESTLNYCREEEGGGIEKINLAHTCARK